MDWSSPSEQMLTRTGSVLTRLARQTKADWRDLVQAQTALLLAQFLVWTRPVGRFVEDAQIREPGLQEPMDLRSKAWRDAFKLGVAVRRAADHGLIHPKCLVRAVALSLMLDHRGIKGSRVRIGVRRDAGEFAAHAWVELGQRVLGDEAQRVESFANLVDLQVI